MKSKRRGWFACFSLFVIVLGTLIIGLAGGVILDRGILARIVPIGGVPPEAESNFRLMAEAWNAIQLRYVDRSSVISDTLTYGAISGMVDALGDTGHSRFLSPAALKAQAEFTRGEYDGIGAYVELKDGQVVIVAPIDGTPAQAAGLAPGDIVLQVDGQDLTGLSLDQARQRIMGAAGTEVKLTVRDPDTGATRELVLTRARIKVDNVSWAPIPGTDLAQVRIVGFSQGVTAELKTTLAEVQAQGIKGIVLDLRNNPGGLLDEAVGTVSQFLGTGNVLLERDAKGIDTPIPVTDGGVALDIPMVVLVNQGSASASEIVSGALQDAARATLVGETTFGTGTVLNTIPLSDGSALLLATQQWLTPSGRIIWHKGIVPDIEVAVEDDVRLIGPESLRTMTAEELLSTADAQFLRAIEVLRDRPAQ